MTLKTIVAGALVVGSAFPDPPFELMREGAPAGFDITLMQAICAELGLAWRSRRYEGSDFNRMFDGLADGSWDCIASGTTVTPDRAAKASFCRPYLQSGQSLVCNVRRTPGIRSLADMMGHIVGVQHGNTSEPVCLRLKAEGKVADVRIYPYDGITAMLDDLEAGAIAGVMKLAPVMRWLTKGRPDLCIVEEKITLEALAIAVRHGDDALRQAIDAAQVRLAADGRLNALVAQWIGP